MSLTAENLSLGYGNVPVLVDINLQLEAGNILAILGPNGCGKSTLLHALSGGRKPDKGTVALDRQALEHWSPHDLARRRAVLAQQSTLDFNFTVFEVVLLGRAPHMVRSETPHDHRIVRQALATMDLEAVADRSYLSLSGGERQRVHCARVLAQIEREPMTGQFLLLDEPTNNLDPAHRFSLLRWVAGLSQRGVAVAAILHDPNLALAYCSHALLLKDGRVFAQGTTDAVLTAANVAQLYNTKASLIETLDGHRLFHMSPAEPSPAESP